MKLIGLIGLGAVATMIATGAGAVTITGLYNTGVDNTGVARPGNGADAHWLLNGGPAFTGGTNNVFPLGRWLNETSTSRWLTPTRNAGDSFDRTADGLYTYTLAFSLAGFQPGTASFTGRFAVDNRVDSISLNGTTLTGSGGSFSSYTSFSSTGATFAQNNVLTFVVRNFASTTGSATGNPTGLRVEFTGSDVTAVPEPATWGLLIAGFAMTGLSMRRRKSVAA